MTKKRIIFDDTDIRHAQLKIQLQYDGLTQAEFFRALMTGYLEKNEEIVSYIDSYKLNKGVQSKTKVKMIQKEREEGEATMSKFGFKDEELENIFDIIANEYPEL